MRPRAAIAPAAPIAAIMPVWALAVGAAKSVDSLDEAAASSVAEDCVVEVEDPVVEVEDFVADGWLAQGFGGISVGTVTPAPVQMPFAKESTAGIACVQRCSSHEMP